MRTAIEIALLGGKAVIVEKRDRYSRNNVLHLWPFLIHDLKAFGAKKFFGKFCAGSIDHISKYYQDKRLQLQSCCEMHADVSIRLTTGIRTLQCILLKVALLMGVEIHAGVAFEGLVEPDTSGDESEWRAIQIVLSLS